MKDEIVSYFFESYYLEGEFQAGAPLVLESSSKCRGSIHSNINWGLSFYFQIISFLEFFWDVVVVFLFKLGMATGQGGDGFRYPIPIPA